jgi:hypothetical protein
MNLRPPITTDLDLAARIIQDHCRHNGLTLDDLTSNTGHHLDVLHCVRLIRRRTTLPTHTIGAIFNLSLPATMALL